MKSKTDWARVRREPAKPTKEHPELSLDQIARGVVRIGLKPVTRPPTKKAVTIYLDPDVLERLKALGSGYQTRINAILRAFLDYST